MRLDTTLEPPVLGPVVAELTNAGTRGYFWMDLLCRGSLAREVPNCDAAISECSEWSTIPRQNRQKKLLDDGWGYHDDESEPLARALEASGEHSVPSNFLAPFLHLSSHTIGEHLGDWARALRLGRRVLDGQTPTVETARAWGRLWVVAVLAGDLIEAADLELSYLKAAGCDFGEASRTADEDALMQRCAEMSLECWRKCGDWINEERALHLSAVVANATGDPISGLAHANAALAIIAANGQRPLDAARLQLVRAVSLARMGDDDGRSHAMMCDITQMMR